MANIVTFDWLLDRLQDLEGFRPTYYVPLGEKSEKNYYTIGYGHREQVFEDDWRFARTISKKEARELLAQDVDDVDFALRRCEIGRIYESLPIFRRYALISFVFNVGIRTFLRSTVCKNIKAGYFSEVPEILMKYVYSGKNRLKGLERRRAFECDLWNGVYR